MVFQAQVFRFSLTAVESVHLGPHAGNTLRGALGYALADTPEYGRWFRPESAPGRGPSGLADPPRPFVLRASHLDGVTVGPGHTFGFDVHSFDTRADPLELFRDAVNRAAAVGIGFDRGRAEVNGSPSVERVVVPLVAPSAAVQRLRVHYLTPTELKGGSNASFATLFARARDRVATILRLYSGASVDGVDFRGMGDRAAAVQTVRTSLTVTQAERRSTRTGQTHPLGGVTGVVEFEGNLTEFVPWLEAAQWTGVGRQTVWGKGAIRVESVPGCR